MIRRSLFAGLAALSVLAATSTRGDDGDEKRFTLLFTTDIHAHYLGKDDGKGHRTGGMAAVAAKVKEIRESSKDPVFVFDSGDMLSGNPASELEYQGVVGGALFEMMNQVGYDAWCIGNHDFDHGRENTAKIVKMLKFPTLNANLTVTGNPPIAFEQWKIIEKGGVKLGVLGLMSEGFDKLTRKDLVQGITAGSASAAARAAVAALTSKCDAIVALSHCGSGEDIRLCDRVQGMDVILSGHNHAPLRAAKHGDTIVTEGHVWAESLGRLDLTAKNGKVTHFHGETISLEPAEAQGELKKVLDFVHENVEKKLEEVIAKIDTPWKRQNKEECNVGDFFADGLREYAHADCAFLNSGGIRSDKEGPNITLGDVHEIFAIENATVAFEVTGEDLKKICARNMGSTAYGILQLSGVRFEYTKSGKTADVSNVTVNGQPLDPEKKYRCASIDFVAIDQHDKYFGSDVKVLNTEKLADGMTTVAVNWVREQGKKGVIHATVDGRMKKR